MTAQRLVIDVGGSNVRFARAGECGEISSFARYPTQRFATFTDALSAYLIATGNKRDIAECAIAAAGPVDAGRVRLTNVAWTIQRDEVVEMLGGLPVSIVNDLEAVAAALPYLSGGDLKQLGGPPPLHPAGQTKLAFNIGTGCGAAIAWHRDGVWHTAPTEAGHMSLATDDSGLKNAFPEGASVECLLSGAGVERLHASLARDDATASNLALDATAILSGSSQDVATTQTLEILSDVIGRFTGDLALATAAWGGVYITGSVATAWAHSANTGRFRRAFENKGVMKERMIAVPTVVIARDDVALYGLSKIDSTVA